MHEEKETTVDIGLRLVTHEENAKKSPATKR